MSQHPTIGHQHPAPPGEGSAAWAVALQLISCHVPHVPHIPQKGGTANARGRAFKGMSRRRRYLRRNCEAPKLDFTSQRMQGTRQIAVPIQKLVRPWSPWDQKCYTDFFWKKNKVICYPLWNFQNGRHFVVPFLKMCQLYEMYPKGHTPVTFLEIEGHTHTQPPLAFSD